MAGPNDTDVKIALNTTADTAAVEKAKDALEELNDAQKQGAESAKKLGSESSNADPQLAQLINLQRAQIAQRIALQINAIGIEVRGLAAEFRESDRELSETLTNTATGIDSVTGALNGAAQGFAAGGPFGAAVGATVGLLSGPLKQAYTEMISDLEKASIAKKREGELVKLLAEERAKYETNLKISTIRKSYEEEVRLLENQLNLLRDINEIREAQGNTELSAAQADLTLAKTGGGNVGNAQANVLAVEYGNQLDLLDSKLAEYQSAAAVAADTLSKAKESFGSISQIADRDEQAYKDAAAAVANAEKAANLSNAALAKQTALYEEERKQAANEFAAKFAELRSNSLAAVTEGAAQTLSAIQAQAQASGGNISVQAKTSMQALEKILADGVVKPEEMARLTDAIVRIRTSREGADKLILDGLNSVERSLSTIFTTLPGLVQKIQSLEGRSAQTGGY